MLAGGRAQRLGGIPKGLEMVDGTRIIDRVAAALRAATSELVLVANDVGAARWLPDARVLADRRTGAGGLAGVEAALELGRDIVIVAWDMPFVTGELLQALVSEALAKRVDAVLPASHAPHGVEPFCAFYSAGAREDVRRFLDAGGRAAHLFVQQLSSVRVLQPERVGQFGDPRRLFFSVNTAEDLADARAMAGAG